MMRNAIAPLLLLGACTPRPAFIPAPQRVFAHVQALPRPVRDLAVGALWINGQGAYGPGAAADNLETQQGISGVTIDNDVAASLSLGFLQYLDLDPTLQSKVIVRLNDVTLVQVKDMASLEGPSEQPRVYEALRVGSATITTNKEVGVAIEARASERGLPVMGRGSSGRRTTFSIDVKDVYLAVRIATLHKATSPAARLRLRAEPRSAKVSGLTIEASASASGECKEGRLSAKKGTGVAITPTKFDPQAPTEIKLAFPIAENGAVFDHLSIEPDSSGGCAIRIHVGGTTLISETE